MVTDCGERLEEYNCSDAHMLLISSSMYPLLIDSEDVHVQ